MNTGMTFFFKSDLKKQKLNILDSNIATNQENLLSISELIDSIAAHMKKPLENGQSSITWENIIACVEEIQKQCNKDLTAQSWMINNFVNALGSTLGAQFRATVTKLATHRIHIGGSKKINWFGHTNFTSGIKDLLELLKLRQEAIHICSETDETKKRKAQDHFIGQVFFSENHRIARESSKLIGQIGCDEKHLAEKFLNPFECYIPSFRDDVRAIDKSELIYGAFNTDPNTRFKFYESIRAQTWTDKKAQDALAKALRNQIVDREISEIEKKAILALFENINWTSPVAFIIAKDVLCRMENDPTKPTFFSYITIPNDDLIFLGSKDKLPKIIFAIKRREFGTDPKTLLGLAKLIKSLSWDERETEGTEKKSVVRNPYSPELTPKPASSPAHLLAEAIRDHAFGTDKDTLEELWKSVLSISWTDPKAQEIIAQAAVDQLKKHHQDQLKLIAVMANAQKWNLESLEILTHDIQLTAEEIIHTITPLAASRSTTPEETPSPSSSSQGLSSASSSSSITPWSCPVNTEHLS